MNRPVQFTISRPRLAFAARLCLAWDAARLAGGNVLMRGLTKSNQEMASHLADFTINADGFGAFYRNLGNTGTDDHVTVNIGANFSGTITVDSQPGDGEIDKTTVTLPDGWTLQVDNLVEDGGEDPGFKDWSCQVLDAQGRAVGTLSSNDIPGVPCFCAGTLIDTPDGPVPVEALVAARQLLPLDGIDIAAEMQEVDDIHLLFDRHAVVIANGAEIESLYTGPETLQSLGRAEMEEILALSPALRQPDHRPDPAWPDPARPIPSGRKARKLAMRHLQHRQPLVAQALA